MEIGFAEALAAIGLLLAATATASGLIHRSILSVVVLSTVAGAALNLAGVLEVDPSSYAVIFVVELVLLVTLFSDGLLVEQEAAQRNWRAPARALVIAMPINAACLAGGAKLLFPSLGWEEAFLIGFILSPTDPVITSAVVSSANVPRRVRTILNLESGLNDGLALPFVLFFLALATQQGASTASIGGDLALETLIGAAAGVALGFLAGETLNRLPDSAITAKFEGLYALGIGLASFGIADLLGGNGLIAAFGAGLVLALERHEIPDVFHDFNEGVAGVLQVVAFALFGALVIETGMPDDVLAVGAFVVFALFLARPLSVLVAFAGIKLSKPERLFVAWFGPKGIASMLFALFVLNSSAPDRTLVFDVAAFTILASVVAHGLTDTVGAKWIERRLAPQKG